MEPMINHIDLCGTMASAPSFSHENHGRRFYRFLLEVERLSGTVDTLPVLASWELLEQADVSWGERVAVSGQFLGWIMGIGEGIRIVGPEPVVSRMRGEALQYGQWLPFTDAGEHEHIHARQILRHLNRARKVHVRHLQQPHGLLAHGIILWILLRAPHDVELGVRHFLLRHKEGPNERHDILDGYDAHDRTDVDAALSWFQLTDTGEPLHVHAIGHDADFLRRTA